MTNMETSWHSYPKVYALGHPSIMQLLEDEVWAQEKIDGSQFSFGVFGGVLKCKSKGKELVLDAPEQMFAPAVEYVKSIKDKLVDGWTYRAEFLGKPKHNTICYDKHPQNHLVLFDVNEGFEKYISPTSLSKIANELGIDSTPIYSHGKINNPADIEALLTMDSFLGGSKIEGVVIKNYSRYGRDGKVLMGKYVSEAFKEKHGKERKKNNPSSRDVIYRIGDELRTEARWQKAIQHLKERGEYCGDVKDIGKLIKEIQSDVGVECKEEIIRDLWRYAWPQISRQIIRGFPEWYKAILLKKQFEVKND